MRSIEKTVEVTENVTFEKTATKENIIEYTINKKSEYVHVKIELLAEDDSVVGSEDFYFSGADFKETVSDFDLWNMIDQSRN